MNCYYCENIEEPPILVTLNEYESRHAMTSRRQKVGDEVALIDGKGVRATGIVHSITRTKVDIEIEARSQVQRQKPGIILASALPKGERQKVMLDMMCQLGVDEFVPLSCDRSVVKSGANVERWSRICLQACKQSHNPFLPRIEQPEQPVNLARKMKGSEISVWVADPVTDQVSLQALHDTVVLCIGPEGGFSDTEKKGMLEAGAHFLCLGGNILRIETAVVVSISTARQCYGREGHL